MRACWLLEQAKPMQMRRGPADGPLALRKASQTTVMEKV